MKLYSRAILIASLGIPAFCLAAFCQERSADVAPQAADERALAAQVDQLAQSAAKLAETAQSLPPDVAAAAEQAARLDEQFDASGIGDLTDQMAALKAADSADKANLTLLQKVAPFPPAPPVPPVSPVSGKIRLSNRTEGEYDAGARALDQHKYDEAVRDFDTVIASKSTRSDGALYWKAYALNRAGKRDESLAAIADLRKDYPSSAWLNDAQALEAEVKQSSGQPVAPDQETNEDLKLMAINSLMNADAERAIPLVEGILKGNSAPAVKSRALFVLAQSRSPQAQQVLFDYAKGGDNPDLQLRAIQYMGMSGTRDAQQALIGIYAASADLRVKTSILQSLMMAHASDALMNIAKTEKDESLRNAAIRDIAANKSVPTNNLLDLYTTSDTAAKRAIIYGLASRSDGKDLVELIHKETDSSMKMAIMERLSSMHNNKDAMDYMMELLK